MFAIWVHFKGEYWIIENIHTCICIHISITPKKTGLNCGSMTCPTGGAPNINYGKNMEKRGQSAPSPLISQEKSIMEIMATSKNYGKKKVRITSGIFWTLMGEKSNYGKIGRRRRLSKLNGDHKAISFCRIFNQTSKNWDIEHCAGNPEKKHVKTTFSYILTWGSVI